MASLTKRSRRNRNGQRRPYYAIEYQSPSSRKTRKTIWLGFVSARNASTAHDLLSEITEHWDPSLSYPEKIRSRIEGLPTWLRKKFERHGLCHPPHAPHTLGDLIMHFQRTSNVRQGTKATYKQALRSLREKIGAETLLTAITTRDAEEWRSEIAQHLSEATCAKRTNVCKAMFNRAVSLRWLAESPFRGVRSGVQTNESRLVMVPEETIVRVIKACPNDHWRALLALARYAGLRVPSEPMALTWGDVDLINNQLDVFAQKTSRRRKVPMRPPVQTYLAKIRPLSCQPSDRVFPMWTAQSNLGTTLEKIIKRAGLQRWPRLFQNLRASAETDWLSKYPEYEVTKWIGHSARVARTHYLIAQSDNARSATTW